MTLTLYWHDYETFGTDTRRDRPAQFAGQRTDESLQPLGEPLVVYCAPAADYLPAPEACLLTGITPQRALAEGLVEAEFIARVEAELGRPGTCGVGYNSIRFDDEITRNTLYRNLRDPYAREWRNGNSRWDVIDLLRMAYALRPEGMEWPVEAGLPSFRLELLSQANGVEHAAAHDALSDVLATIGLVRRLRAAQPRLYDWGFGLRDKRRVAALLDLGRPQPLLHVSGMYARELGCLAPVIPLARHPDNANEVIVYDLRQPPEVLVDAAAGELREDLFLPSAQRPAERPRVGLKSVHLNRSPALAPMSTMEASAAERWQIDPATVAERARVLLACGEELRAKLQQVYQRAQRSEDADPDLQIYSGGFLDDRDRALLRELVGMPPEALADRRPDFSDARLDELLFRYRARNYPASLQPAEQSRWREFCARRLSGADGFIGLGEFLAELERLRAQQDGGPPHPVLAQLQDYATTLAATAGTPV